MAKEGYDVHGAAGGHSRRGAAPVLPVLAAPADSAQGERHEAACRSFPIQPAMRDSGWSVPGRLPVTMYFDSTGAVVRMLTKFALPGPVAGDDQAIRPLRLDDIEWRALVQADENSSRGQAVLRPGRGFARDEAIDQRPATRRAALRPRSFGDPGRRRRLHAVGRHLPPSVASSFVTTAYPPFAFSSVSSRNLAPGDQGFA